MSALLTVVCWYCNKSFLREKRRIQENIKLQQKQFCSITCLAASRKSLQKLFCENPSCRKEFHRLTSHISSHNFCSRSCAVKINNIRFPKRIALIRICPICQKGFKSNDKFCSVICKNKSQYVSKDYIISTIQEFFKVFQRIPTKAESIYAKSARLRFGTWNRAIVAAGFKPNPVLFSIKHIAKDGHSCDSLAEKIIDDWLFGKKILHERNIPYGKDHMTADFKVGKTLVEFFGLSGQLKAYDALIRKKKQLWKDQNLETISIYPHDLFPVSKLSHIFAKFITPIK